MASSATLICLFALVALGYGEDREERSIGSMFSSGVGSLFGNAVNYFADEGSAKRICEARGFIPLPNPNSKRSLFSLASDIGTGVMAGVGDALFTPEAVESGCYANGYIKKPEVQQPQYQPPQQQRFGPPDVQYIYEPNTVRYQDFEN